MSNTSALIISTKATNSICGFIPATSTSIRPPTRCYASPSPLVIRVPTPKASLRPLLAPAPQHDEVVLEPAVVVLTAVRTTPPCPGSGSTACALLAPPAHPTQAGGT